MAWHEFGLHKRAKTGHPSFLCAAYVNRVYLVGTRLNICQTAVASIRTHTQTHRHTRAPRRRRKKIGKNVAAKLSKRMITWWTRRGQRVGWRGTCPCPVPCGNESQIYRFALLSAGRLLCKWRPVVWNRPARTSLDTLTDLFIYSSALARARPTWFMRLDWRCPVVVRRGADGHKIAPHESISPAVMMMIIDPRRYLPAPPPRYLIISPGISRPSFFQPLMLITYLLC